MSSTALTLYHLETDLLALLDSAELVSDEEKPEYNQALQEALAKTVAKRDRMAGFLRHCSLMQDNCSAEIRRLQNLKKVYASGEERGREYVKCTIESLGLDENGDWAKLEGATCQFSLRSNPASVVITDVDAIPESYKLRSVELDDHTWADILQAIGPIDYELKQKLADAITASQPQPNKKLISKDLKAGNVIPGADLDIEGHHVELR